MSKLVQCKAAAVVLLSIFLYIACGRSEQPRQETYARPNKGARPSHHEAKRRGTSEAIPGDFDYYVLSLSWAPTFCESTEHQHARECEPSRSAGFVIHGLWPQLENGRSPEFCGNARPLDESAMNEALTLIPDAGLARHEWRAHGTCSGLSPTEYFSAIRTARQTIQIPEPYRSPRRGLRTSASAVEQRFAQASGIAQHNAIHVHCIRDEVSEVRFCFTKSLSPRPCSENVGECRAGAIFMSPVR